VSGPEALPAEEAGRLLGVKLPTLYAYVSRGLVGSVAGRGRARLYLRSDLERLQGRRRGPAPRAEGRAVESPLRWGEPLLESAITAIGERGPRYRGHLAVDLALADARFESVAEL